MKSLRWLALLALVACAREPETFGPRVPGQCVRVSSSQVWLWRCELDDAVCYSGGNQGGVSCYRKNGCELSVIDGTVPLMEDNAR